MNVSEDFKFSTLTLPLISLKAYFKWPLVVIFISCLSLSSSQTVRLSVAGSEISIRFLILKMNLSATGPHSYSSLPRYWSVRRKTAFPCQYFSSAAPVPSAPKYIISVTNVFTAMTCLFFSYFKFHSLCNWMHCPSAFFCFLSGFLFVYLFYIRVFTYREVSIRLLIQHVNKYRK